MPDLQKSIQSLLDQSATELSHGRFTEAYEVAARAISLSPKTPKAHELAARSAAKLSQWDQSANHWISLTELQPRRASVYHRAVDALSNNLQHQRACDLLDKGLSVQPQQPLLLVKKLSVLSRQDEQEVAEAHRQCIRSSIARNGDVELVVEYVRYLCMTHELDEASAILDSTQLTLRSDCRLRALRARVSFELGEIAESRSYWLSLVDDAGHRNQYEVAIYLARIAVKDGNRELIEKFATRACALDPSRTEPVAQLIEYVYLKQHPEVALDRALWLSKADRSAVGFSVLVARCFLRLDRMIDLEQHVLKVLAEVSNPESFLDKVGRMIRESDGDEAELQFWCFVTESITDSDSDSDSESKSNTDSVADSAVKTEVVGLGLHRVTARALSRVGRWTDLVEHCSRYKTSVESPYHSEWTALLLSALMRSGDLQRAKEIVRVACQQYPDDWMFWRDSIRIPLNANDVDKALVQLRCALAQFDAASVSDGLIRAKLNIAAEQFIDAKEELRKILQMKRRSVLQVEKIGNFDEVDSGLSDQDWLDAQRLLLRLVINEGDYIEASVCLELLHDFGVTDEQFTQALEKTNCWKAAANGGVDLIKGFESSALMPEALIEQVGSVDFVKPASSSSAIIVTGSLGPGGAERQVVATLDGLKAINHEFDEVSVVSFRLNPQTQSDFFLADLQRNGHRVQGLDQLDLNSLVESAVDEYPDSARRMTLIRSLPPELCDRCMGLYALFVNERPAVVQSWQDTTNVITGIAAILAGVPKIVLTTCSTRPRSRNRYRRYLDVAYKAFAKRTDVVIINNSDAGARDYERWLGFTSGSVLTVNNGLNTREVRARATSLSREAVCTDLGFPVDCRLLGGVMRLSDVKRPELWLDVAIELVRRDPDYCCVLIGDGSLRTKLITKIESLGLEENIKLPGTRIPVEPWIAAMDVLFLSSRMEGLPNVLVEAQTLGVPVISMDVGGAGEAFLNDQTGVLIDQPDPAVIAKCVISMTEEHDWLNQAPALARQFADEKFSLNTLAAETLKQFQINSEKSVLVKNDDLDKKGLKLAS